MVKSSIMPQNQKVRVRFAPSPTGVPHVGNIRTALFNYFFAKANQGTFILRIEDTDQARKVPGAEDVIKESLLWLGVAWDEYIVQSERILEYKKYAQELVEKGLARNDAGAVRFIVPKEDNKISWQDAVGNKRVEFNNRDIEDFIILKSDGFPTYHLANVIDDYAGKISHVIRGEDWISSTPKHILLYLAFGWEKDIPVFAHVPNILGTDKKKLSKRRGAKSVLDFKKEGFLPEALLNYLMLLGWSPKDDREILSKTDFEQEFDLSKINIAPAVFDEKKLLWINGEYIRKTQISKLKSQIIEFDSEISSIPNFEKYISFAQTRIKTLAEFRDLVESKKVVLSQDQKKLAEELIRVYKELSEWNSKTISTATIAVRDQVGASTKDIYTVLTGRPQGLPFEEKLKIQGQGDTISWLEEMLKNK